jgi:PiT family inorganic phosphate transporter
VTTHNIIILVSAFAFGLFMAWSIGANDLANIMSTTMGSKAISVRKAIVIALIFEVAGALLGGTNVAKTIQHGIINTQITTYPPEIFIYGMLSVLLASATWMTLASYLGMPVSITNVTVGALIGFGWLTLDAHAIHWNTVTHIGISWVASPTIAAVVAYFLFLSVQCSIFTAVDPIKKAHQYIPIYLFLVGFILSEITIIKGLKHFGITLDLRHNILLAITSGVIILIIGSLILKRIKCEDKNDQKERFAYIEKMFAFLMVLTACAMVYAHGSNDVAISVGPIAAIISLMKTGHAMLNGLLIDSILSFGALGVTIGFVTYGRKIIKTVGSGITALTPSRAYCATIAAASTVVVSTSTGIPVSATQTLVGGILGVGLARGIGALDLRVVRNIFTSWVVTIPIAAGLTTLYFDLIKHILV